MSDGIRVDVKIDEKALKMKIDNLIDDKTMLEIHDKFAQMCNPYVPMYEGALSQTTQITPEYVRYTQPYAHYMYVGEIYSPNIPIKNKDGDIVGWFSPKGKKKTPTGRQMQYSKEKHNLASKEWDKAMMADKGEEFMQAVRDILVRRAKELYG